MGGGRWLGNGKAVSFTGETGITCAPSSKLAIRSDRTDARPVMGHSGQLLHQDQETDEAWSGCALSFPGKLSSWVQGSSAESNPQAKGHSSIREDWAARPRSCGPELLAELFGLLTTGLAAWTRPLTSRVSVPLCRKGKSILLLPNPVSWARDADG